jgi:hypothetical protein
VRFINPAGVSVTYGRRQRGEAAVLFLAILQLAALCFFQENNEANTDEFQFNDESRRKTWNFKS